MDGDTPLKAALCVTGCRRCQWIWPAAHDLDDNCQGRRASGRQTFITNTTQGSACLCSGVHLLHYKLIL